MNSSQPTYTWRRPAAIQWSMCVWLTTDQQLLEFGCDPRHFVVGDGVDEVVDVGPVVAVRIDVGRQKGNQSAVAPDLPHPHTPLHVHPYAASHG